MKLICCSVFLALMGTISMNVHAAGSVLKIKCEDKDVGAEISINGVFKGECPLTIQVEAGTVQLKMLKKIDASHEGVFEQTFRMGDGVIKNIEAELTVHLTAEGQRHEDERLAAEAANRAEAARLEEERLNHVREENKRAARLAGQITKDCDICPEMVIIPSGKFEMGSNQYDHEKPVHNVQVNAFVLGKTEVTQGQWRAVMGSNPSNFSSCGDDCPVENVSWNDAQVFIQKLNAKTGNQYRLPSEAEWEYACRAGGQEAYCGSDNADSVAWYKSNSGRSTHPVSRKQPNAFGLYDMSGNVVEWMEDSWHANYNGAPTNGSAWQGDGAMRVLRSGSWGLDPRDARADGRSMDKPASRGSFGGFRLAGILPPSGRLNAGVQRHEEELLVVSPMPEEGRLASVHKENRKDVGLAGQIIKDCPDCPDMVIIPSGVFEMGSVNGSADEKPVHSVSIDNIALGKTEVTQGQWRAVMGNNPSKFSSCGDDCPVESVSWTDAQTFIQKLNTKTGKQYRLPSEAEWEYACRSGGQQAYCGSDNVDSVAWHQDNSGGWFAANSTHPVSRKQPNAFGLYDMSGNVWEWVEDSYHDSYNGAPTNGSAWQRDGAMRVFRGGSWFNYPKRARAANRFRSEPAIRYDSLGFRVARMLP